MGPNLLSWSAKKQVMVARSMAEAEYRALASTMAELMWFMHLLMSTGYNLPLPILHLALSMAKNLVFHHHTKHIEIDVHFMREQVARWLIRLTHVSDQEQVADIFTLCASKFIPNRSKLYISPILPWSWEEMKRQMSFNLSKITHILIFCMVLVFCLFHT